MSESMHGTVTLVVGARTFTLQPTLEAALRIETRFGGLRPALDALRTFSIAACADIVVAGAGLKPEQHSEIASTVFQAGVSDVVGRLAPYLVGLMNPVPPSIVARGKPEADSTAQ
ncbi:hypothetical protein M1Q10_12345 [Pseudomonas aeruginosa]|uniref:hypothetical protein n=1 Tax=Pseudomonas aeruginosa TaxID=287 RepID=UPI002010239E|nr:hypothetical protein [Pseudomonas aeruginosa]UPZ07922.1 hypothetical protein M1Q10_12345 [Pseudomonas aeruginosa]